MTKYSCKNCKKDFLHKSISRPPIYCGLDCKYVAVRGKKRPKEIGEKISAARKGMKFTEDHRRNLSLAHQGARPWMDKKTTIECVMCKKEFLVQPNRLKSGAKFCSLKCFSKSMVGRNPWNKGTKGVMKGWNKGIPWSVEQREKLVGKNASNWRGGVTPKHKLIRDSVEYAEWRTAVFTRDNFTCQGCGIRPGAGLGHRVVLQADHIKAFAIYPELRLNVENGRTLCLECHKQTPTYGVNWKKLAMIK